MFLHVEAWRGILNDSTKCCYGVIAGKGQKCIFAPVNVSGMSETGKCSYQLMLCTYLSYISGSYFLVFTIYKLSDLYSLDF